MIRHDRGQKQVTDKQPEQIQMESLDARRVCSSSANLCRGGQTAHELRIFLTTGWKVDSVKLFRS